MTLIEAVADAVVYSTVSVGLKLVVNVCVPVLNTVPKGGIYVKLPGTEEVASR